jgi:hypothetical protein
LPQAKHLCVLQVLHCFGDCLAPEGKAIGFLHVLQMKVRICLILLLSPRLGPVAGNAQALAVADVIPSLWCCDNRDNVVSLSLTLAAAYSAAALALPAVTSQHGQPPGSVLLATVATLVSIGTVLYAACLASHPRRLKGRHTARHQSPKSRSV